MTLIYNYDSLKKKNPNTFYCIKKVLLTNIIIRNGVVMHLKSTGVIRRIDELGRIVIPKEIRRNLGIRDGENIEIYIEDEEILLKKYNRMSNFSDLAKNLCEIIYNDFNYKMMISDREKIIASNTENYNLINKELNKECLKIIEEREIQKLENTKLKIEDKELEGNFILIPIISVNESLGLIIIYSNNKITELEESIGKLVASIFSRKLDI